MEIRRPLDMFIPDDLLALAKVFKEAGHQLFVVGGAVRDALLGHLPKDFDVATDATPDQIRLFLEPQGHTVLDVGEAFGVTMLVLPFPLEKVEIATFRRDMTEGRHPVVRHATIQEDVQRRDLTINSLFYDISSREVIDMVGGLADLEARVIRTVGNPEDRFREDRLRVLRAVRFASRFGWTLEEGTANAIVRDSSLGGVSPERIRDEIVRGIIGSKTVRRFLADLERFDMWKHVLPGLKVGPVPDVLVSSSGPESRSVSIILAVLLDGNQHDHVAKTLQALKYTSDEVNQVRFLFGFRDASPATAYRLRKRFDALNVSDELLIGYCGERGAPATNVLRAFLGYRPSVSGATLLSEGFSGAGLGRELERRETILFQQLHDAT